MHFVKFAVHNLKLQSVSTDNGTWFWKEHIHRVTLC